MKFIKAYCGDNDFIILDARNSNVPPNLKSLVPYLTTRHKGIGADTIILMEPSKDTDFKLRFFNPDSTEYALCGNGTLCALLYEGKPKTTFTTDLGAFSGEITQKGKVKTQVPKPKDVKLLLPLNIKNNRYNFSFVDIGVPHTIMFVKDVNSVNLLELGRIVRQHRHFGKLGTNVNFVQIIDKNVMAIRTYEKGVEGETACGSGSCAAVVAGWLKQVLVSPVNVITKGGSLNICINSLEDIWLDGSPKIVYKGEIELPNRN